LRNGAAVLFVGDGKRQSSGESDKEMRPDGIKRLLLQEEPVR
jgi:hypothetical protein